MKKKGSLLAMAMALFMLSGIFSGLAYGMVETPCADEGFVDRLSSPGKLEIVRMPAPNKMYPREAPPQKIPKIDYNADNFYFQMEYVSMDLSKTDVNSAGPDIYLATYDTKTKWPVKMPGYFNPEMVLEQAKNPGLGIRSLHDRGIDGRNIGIAIIDNNPLLVNHREYYKQLKLYEEIHVFANDSEAQMHAPAVSSIAVGENVGVAPGADLYYFRIWPGAFRDGKRVEDYSVWGTVINRILAINKMLPDNKKIRVISISDGWGEKPAGCDVAIAAINKAKAEGIFVITSNLPRDYPGMQFMGLGRKPCGDPDDVNSYNLYSPLRSDYGIINHLKGVLFVPSDAKTTASCVGINDYVYYGIGGRSWSIPWIAGVYALGCQVNRQITPEQFWKTALETGDTITVQHDGKSYEMSKVINPQKLIAAMKK